jgi:hypothetical protein
MRARCRKAGLLTFLLGALLIAGVLAVVASHRSWRRVGENATAVQLVVGVLAPGAVGCQAHEPLPAGTAAVGFHAVPGSPGVIRARVQLREAGRYSGIGANGALAGNGTVVAPLAHKLGREVVAVLCVQNTGRATLALQGAATGAADQVTVSAGGKALPNMVGRVRVDDLIDTRPTSLWSVLGKLPGRFATATGSELAPWLVVIGLLATLVLTAALLWAPGSENDER